MVAAGHGNIIVSGLIHHAQTRPGCFLYATACALIEADRARPGTAEHIAALPGVTILELDLPAALAVAHERTWAEAHTRYAAEPAADLPNGAFIATTAPDRWKGQPVRVIDLSQ